MSRFLPVIVIFTLLLGALFAKPTIISQLQKKGILAYTPKHELLKQEYVEKILQADGSFDPNAKEAIWFNKKVSLPGMELARAITENPQMVLGVNSREKWIEVDLTLQRLFAHEGKKVVYQFPISSGLPWMPTVTGEFRIWAKIRAQRMSGGSIADGTYYDLPNVPFVQYFYGAYGIHGAYWHTDFGFPRSHGCVNLSVADAGKLFAWTNPPTEGNKSITNIAANTSTRVVIHGNTPTKLN